MAYERTWQFLPVQGPRVPSATNQHLGWVMWNIKQMLTGGAPSITQGLWTIYASSDGTTYGYDSTDRWPSPYNLIATAETSGSPSAPRAWIILTRTMNGTPVWLTMHNTSSAGGATALGRFNFVLGGAAPTGGSTTSNPTNSLVLQTNGTSGNAHVFLNDLTNPRRFYGAVSTLGDFWFGQTVAGDMEYGGMVFAPVGCKSNDLWPVYCYAAPGYDNLNSVYPFGGATLFVPATVGLTGWVGKNYAGATGYPFLAPGITFAHLDSSDVSLYDFPAWVLVANNAIISSTTALHARGRLPDVGLCASLGTGSTTQASTRPCAIGTVIRDGLGDVKYVVLNQTILPYNALVS